MINNLTKPLLVSWTSGRIFLRDLHIVKGRSHWSQFDGLSLYQLGSLHILQVMVRSRFPFTFWFKKFMTPTSELLLSAQTIIYGFAVARLLHGAPGIFTLKKSSVSVIIVWITCCLHIALSLWSITNRFELRLDFFDFWLNYFFSFLRK